MNLSLDEQYLAWLYFQVGSFKSRHRSESHWALLRQLHHTEFAWFVPNDDNRVEDGRDLRREFAEDNDILAPEKWLALPCSMLELFVGLSRRLAFETEGQPSEWFWQLLANVRLTEFNDRVHPGNQEYIDGVLESIIWRNYAPSGEGGIFPLQHPDRDQTKVELWYQLNAYLVENNL